MLFTFPSRYWFAIGRQEYLALEGGPPDFPRDSTCPAVLRCPAEGAGRVSPTGLSPPLADLPRSFGYAPDVCTLAVTAATTTGSSNPACATPAGLARTRFGLAPVRSPLLGGSRLISSPRGTEMFQFPRLPLPSLWIRLGVTGHDSGRVAPFGNPRINAC